MILVQNFFSIKLYKFTQTEEISKVYEQNICLVYLSYEFNSYQVILA